VHPPTPPALLSTPFTSPTTSSTYMAHERAYSFQYMPTSISFYPPTACAHRSFHAASSRPSPSPYHSCATGHVATFTFHIVILNYVYSHDYPSMILVVMGLEKGLTLKALQEPAPILSVTNPALSESINALGQINALVELIQKVSTKRLSPPV